MFLREYAPDVLDALAQDLRLVTLRCSCEYLAELNAFDEIIIRMRLGSLTQNRLTFSFDYVRETDDGELTVARGEQEVACMRSEQGRLSPTHIPESFRRALEAYAG